jgi:hypothetical protein
VLTIHRPALRRALAASAALLLAACAAPVQQPINGYLCCNLRLNKGWVSSANIQGGSLLPFGEPARITSIKRTYYAYGSVRDAEYGFSEDSAKSEADTLRWARRIIVAEDPRLVFSQWPSEIRAAVSAAKVMKGMTRAQVIMAIAYPAPADTPDLSSRTWRYWTTIDDTPVELQFDANDVLERITGSEAGLRLVELGR